MDIEITTGIGASSLFVRDANRNHRGIYTVEAKNSSGTKKADVNVRVQGLCYQTLINNFRLFIGTKSNFVKPHCITII